MTKKVIRFSGIDKAVEDSKYAKHGAFYLSPWKEVYFRQYVTPASAPRDTGYCEIVATIKPGVKYNRDEIRALALKLYHTLV
jgi:hypothetical protein